MADVIFSGGSGLLVAALSGEIDQHSARGLRESIDRRIDYERPQKLRLNFDAVTFMDSSGIGFVLGRYSLVNRYGGNVEVVNLSMRNHKMMRLAGLDKLVKLKIKEVTEHETVK